jgi:hypothetical protein
VTVERRTHDMGGQPAGPINLDEHATEPWEKLITAMVGSLRGRGLMTVDELRRAIEDLSPEDYEKPYFERWSAAILDLWQEKGLLTRTEVEAKMGEIKKRLEG